MQAVVYVDKAPYREIGLRLTSLCDHARTRAARTDFCSVIWALFPTGWNLERCKTFTVRAWVHAWDDAPVGGQVLFGVQF